MRVRVRVRVRARARARVRVCTARRLICVCVRLRVMCVKQELTFQIGTKTKGAGSSGTASNFNYSETLKAQGGAAESDGAMSEMPEDDGAAESVGAMSEMSEDDGAAESDGAMSEEDGAADTEEESEGDEEMATKEEGKARSVLASSFNLLYLPLARRASFQLFSLLTTPFSCCFLLQVGNLADAMSAMSVSAMKHRIRNGSESSSEEECPTVSFTLKLLSGSKDVTASLNATLTEVLRDNGLTASRDTRLTRPTGDVRLDVPLEDLNIHPGDVLTEMPRMRGGGGGAAKGSGAGKTATEKELKVLAGAVRRSLSNLKEVLKSHEETRDEAALLTAKKELRCLMEELQLRHTPCQRCTGEECDTLWCEAGEHAVHSKEDMWPNFADCQDCATSKECADQMGISVEEAEQIASGDAGDADDDDSGDSDDADGADPVVPTMGSAFSSDYAGDGPSGIKCEYHGCTKNATSVMVCLKSGYRLCEQHVAPCMAAERELIILAGGRFTSVDGTSYELQDDAELGFVVDWPKQVLEPFLLLTKKQKNKKSGVKLGVSKDFRGASCPIFYRHGRVERRHKSHGKVRWVQLQPTTEANMVTLNALGHMPNDPDSRRVQQMLCEGVDAGVANYVVTESNQTGNHNRNKYVQVAPGKHKG